MKTEREEFEDVLGRPEINPDGVEKPISYVLGWKIWQAARTPLLERIANAQGECDAAEKLINHQMDELAVAHTKIAELEQSTEYAWKNTRIIDKARQEAEDSVRPSKIRAHINDEWVELTWDGKKYVGLPKHLWPLKP